MDVQLFSLEAIRAAQEHIADVAVQTRAREQIDAILQGKCEFIIAMKSGCSVREKDISFRRT